LTSRARAPRDAGLAALRGLEVARRARRAHAVGRRARRRGLVLARSARRDGVAHAVGRARGRGEGVLASGARRRVRGTVAIGDVSWRSVLVFASQARGHADTGVAIVGIRVRGAIDTCSTLTVGRSRSRAGLAKARRALGPGSAGVLASTVRERTTRARSTRAIARCRSISGCERPSGARYANVDTCIRADDLREGIAGHAHGTLAIRRGSALSGDTEAHGASRPRLTRVHARSGCECALRASGTITISSRSGCCSFVRASLARGAHGLAGSAVVGVGERGARGAGLADAVRRGGAGGELAEAGRARAPGFARIVTSADLEGTANARRADAVGKGSWRSSLVVARFASGNGVADAIRRGCWGDKRKVACGAVIFYL
jgi:hypothetical protein